jgi:hypothetical protein
MNSGLPSTDQQYLTGALPVGCFGPDAAWTSVKRCCNTRRFLRSSVTTPAGSVFLRLEKKRD